MATERTNSRSYLTGLFEGLDFQREAAQIQAKALLSEIADAPPDYRWTYIARRMVRNAVLATVAFTDLAANYPQDITPWADRARKLALVWESLALLRESTNRETALLNAAVNYEIAGYQANAAFIAKQLTTIAQRRADTNLQIMGSLFLQRRFTQLLEMARRAQVEPADNQMVDEDFIERMGLALAGAAFAETVRFFLRGEYAGLASAREIFREAESLFANLGLVDDSNLIHSVRSLLPLMEQRSTWTVLREHIVGKPRWNRYLKLLARGVGSDIFVGRSISELWPSQIAAIEKELLDTATSKIVRMPTSAGKTRIAELAIVNALTSSSNAKCIYVAPYRALVSELQQSFFNLLSDLGYRISSITGTYESDDFEDLLFRDTDVLVTTPEKLDLLRRARPEFLSQVGLFVLDEAHILHDRHRGIKFELLLTSLQRSLPAVRFLTLSAVVPDQTLEDFARWFNASPTRDVMTSRWRPTVQRYAQFRWRAQTGVIEYAPEEDIQMLAEFVPGVIKQAQYEFRNPQTGRINRRKFPDLTNKGQTAAELAFKFAELGSVMVFCSQPGHVRSVANALVERIGLAVRVSQDMPPIYRRKFATGRQPQRTLPESTDVEMASFTSTISSRALLVAREWLGEDHPVSLWLECGIGVHYGVLPDAVRNAIETDFRARRLHVLVATNTVAQGVNLPVRTVIVHSCNRYTNDAYELIPARDYWNIAGRAGRAGEETQGLTIHIVHSNTDAENYRYYLDRRDNVEPVETALIQRLVELMQDRLSVDTLDNEIDAEVLAMLAEEVEGLGPEDMVEAILDASLTRIQAERKNLPLGRLKQVFVHAAQRIVQAVPDSTLRQIYSYTGLSTVSCIAIRSHIIENQVQVRQLFTGSLSDVREIIELLLPAVLSLNEMQSQYEYTGNHGDLLISWLSGTNLSGLASAMSGIDMTPESQLDLAKLIDDLFRYRLPWGVSGYIRIAQEVLSLEHTTISEYVRFLPSMIKFGLPFPAACWVMSVGIPFRRVAIQIAAAFQKEVRPQGYERFREWLSTISSERLRADFQLTSPTLEDVAQAIFAAAVNPLMRGFTTLETFLPIDVIVEGLQYENRYVVALQAEAGIIVELVRDYDNLVDRNAIFVTLSGQAMGYIPRDVAQALAPEMDTGSELIATVQSIANSDIPVVTIRISLDLSQAASV